MLVPIQDLDDKSRVWIYQSSESLSEEQVIAIKSELLQFLEKWTSHNQRLYTSGDVLYNRFIVIMVDETYVGTGGCSIDKSIHFIEDLESRFNLTLLERTQVAYLTNFSDSNITSINTTHLDNLHQMIQNKSISEDTVVFNNLVKTKLDFLSSWKIPLGQSWHKRFL